MEFGCQSMALPIRTLLMKRPEDAFISQEHLDENWEKYNYYGVPDYSKVLEEYAVFEGLVREYVDDILFLPRDNRTGIDSIYAHDSLKITKKGAIYFNTGKELRRGEGAAAREFLEGKGIPTLGTIDAPETMEGGDVLWIDEETVAIGRGYRTTQGAIDKFIELTKDVVKEHFIVPMPHADGREACLHLMSIISFVDVDKAVVYSRYMPIIFREFLNNRGITLIEIDDEEYERLGSNVLALAPGKCVMISGCPEIQQKIEDAGVEVMTYPGPELSFKGTGGPTCLTCPIYRK